MATPIGIPGQQVFRVTSLSSAPRERQKRASRPKVKTGCLTWIRHIKCDEGRPSCVRCTSTGRKCDGYPRPKTSDSRARAVAIVPRPTLLPMVRQLSTDIQGTNVERQYFHRFRVEALKGLSIHSADQGKFWERLVPQVAHRDDAVRHALVALGSTYQLQAREHKSLRSVDKTQLEVFSILQYNKAIQSLQQHVASKSQEEIEITLVCCLIFTCLESLRQNRQGAITHIANGLRIIETLPTSLFDYCQSQAVFDPEGHGQRISREEMRQLLAFYQYLEFSAQVYGAPIKPVLALRQHEAREASAWHAAKRNKKFTSSQECHDTSVSYGLYVFARAWETFPYQGDKVFWSSPEQIRKHQAILTRGRQVTQMIEEYKAGPTAPRADIDRLGYRSVALDHVMCLGVLFMVECMPYQFTRRDMQQFEERYRIQIELIEEVVDLIVDSSTPATKDGDGRREDAGDMPTLTLDNGPLIGIHIILYGTRDPETRKKAMNLLRRMVGKNEGVYEARDMLRLYTALGMDGEGSLEDELLLDEPVGPTLSGFGGLPALEAKFAALTMGQRSDNIS